MKFFSESKKSLRGKLPSELKSSNEKKELISELNKAKQDFINSTTSYDAKDSKAHEKLQRKIATCDELLKNLNKANSTSEDLKNAKDFIKNNLYPYKILEKLISQKEWENLPLAKLKELIPPSTIYTPALIVYEKSLTELSLFEEKDVKGNLNTEATDLILEIALTVDGADEKFKKRALHGNTGTICYEIILPKEEFHDGYEFAANYDLIIKNPKLLDPQNIKAAHVITSHMREDMGKKIDNPYFEDKSLEQSAKIGK